VEDVLLDVTTAIASFDHRMSRAGDVQILERVEHLTS